MNRIKIETLVTIQVHQRDVFSDLTKRFKERKLRKLINSSSLNPSQLLHVNHLKVIRRRHLRRLLPILQKPLTSAKLKRLPRRLMRRKLKLKLKLNLKISKLENSTES
jgi:hypothetical protein